MSRQAIQFILSTALASAAAGFLLIPSRPDWQFSNLCLAAAWLASMRASEYRRPVDRTGLLVTVLFLVVVLGSIALAVLFPAVARVAYHEPTLELPLKIVVVVVWLALIAGLWRRTRQSQP